MSKNETIGEEKTVKKIRVITAVILIIALSFVTVIGSAENDIENPDDIKKFDRLGYIFRSDLSSDSKYVFEHKIA